MDGRHTRIAVGVITLLATAWLVRCAFAWGPCYDEWWHVWIGEARTWAHLWRELHVETHPPLSHLGVMLVSEPGDPIQWARLVAIVPAVCTLPLWFAMARRFDVSVPTALVVLAAMAGAHAFAGMGIVVRGYALATAFAVLCLWGCAPFVADPATVRPRDAWAAAIGAVGAVWSIYTEGLVVLAVAGAIVAMSVSHADRRQALCATLRRSWPALVVLLVGCVLAVVYWRSTHIVMMRTYMPAFMPRPDEGVGVFLVRGVSSLVALFTVAPLRATPWLALPLAIGFVGGLAWPSGSPLTRGRRFVALALVGVIVQLFVAAIARQLPFGGQLRHQYPLFPLLALGLALWLDLPRRRPRWRVVTLVGFAAVSAATGAWSYQYDRVDEFRSTPFDADLRAALGDLATDGDTILTRRYGLIPLYVALRSDAGFAWHGAIPLLGDAADEFTVRMGERSLHAVVSLRHFAAHARLEDGLLDEARAVLDARDLPHLLVMATCQPRDPAPTEAFAKEAAARAGVRVEACRALPEGVLLRVTRDR
jgi:hypothetical protein